MRCQEVCPENQALLERCATGPEFTEEETALLLRSPAADQVPPETLAKLAAMDWATTDLPLLARNLSLLLARGGSAGG